jgi:uncharacterized protein (TIGR03382 family)
MDSTVIMLVVSVLLTFTCCGVGAFLFLAVLGFWLLRRRGKKQISAKEAVSAGVESVSQVFVRGKGGQLEGDDDDDDD